jgi:hypothetical protein
MFSSWPWKEPAVPQVHGDDALKRKRKVQTRASANYYRVVKDDPAHIVELFKMKKSGDMVG